MASVDKKLELWTERGLISGEQRDAIRRFESEAGRRPWGVWGVLGIGATAVATGVISLIAANWDAIGPAIKLGCYFALQGGLGAVVYRRREHPGPLREVSLLLFALLVLAGIGLVGQIYHLRSEGWQGLLLWLALTLPAMWLSQGRLLPHLWVLGGGVTAYVWAANHRGQLLTEADRWLLANALHVAWAALGLLPWRQPRLRQALLTWGFLGATAGGSLISNIAWVAGVGEREAGFGVAAYLVFAALGTLFALHFPASRAQRRGIVAVLVSVALGCTLPFLIRVDSDVLGALGFLLIWSAAAATVGVFEWKRLFDLASVVIALRFVVIYFEVFGSLAETGLGLIVSGLVIMGVGLLWHRQRDRIRHWLEARQ